MEYNTARNHLIIPEYGRHVQKMVEHATGITDKVERNKCVNAIINFMGQNLHTQFQKLKNYKKSQGKCHILKTRLNFHFMELH